MDFLTCIVLSLLTLLHVLISFKTGKAWCEVAASSCPQEFRLEHFLRRLACPGAICLVLRTISIGFLNLVVSNCWFFGVSEPDQHL